MANNKEEAGKGMPRSGDMPGAKRPYATIDVMATEVGGTDRPAGGGASSAASDAGLPPKPGSGPGKPQDASLRVRVAALLQPLKALAHPTPLLTHAAAGAVSAIVVLLAMLLLADDRQPARSQDVSDLSRRVADLEGVLGNRPGAGLRARIDELARSVGALGETQARLARETKALEAKVGNSPEVPQELLARLAKLEEALGAASATDPSVQSTQATALAGKLAALEKAVREAGDAAKVSIPRFDGELSAIRTETGRVAQRLDGLKGEVEERLKGAARAADLAPLAAAVSSLEREVQNFRRRDAERSASTQQVVLALELANLKRAIDRGESFAADLQQAKKVSGGAVDFAPLERYMLEGVPAPQELARSFRKTANAMLDAEAEPAEASLLDRLLAGAKSIVRVRKAGHAADDMSAEAIVGRMEAALKEGRLAEVLANARKLPPKAALVGEDWIKKVEVRHAVEQALADVEASLKTALSASPAAGPEGSR